MHWFICHLFGDNMSFMNCPGNNHLTACDPSSGLSSYNDRVSQYCSLPGRCHSNFHNPWESCSVTYTSFVPFLKWRLLTLEKGHLTRVWGLPPSGPNTSRKPDPQCATSRLFSSSKSMPSGPPSKSPEQIQFCSVLFSPVSIELNER